MVELGYKLSSEEQRPNDLVRYAAMAEDAGFGFSLISDHYHPWIDKQGQSPFVWCVIGAVEELKKLIADGTIGASNDSCLQFKHSFLGAAHRRKLRDYRRWQGGQQGAHSGRTRSGAN